MPKLITHWVNLLDSRTMGSQTRDAGLTPDGFGRLA